MTACAGRVRPKVLLCLAGTLLDMQLNEHVFLVSGGASGLGAGAVAFAGRLGDGRVLVAAAAFRFLRVFFGLGDSFNLFCSIRAVTVRTLAKRSTSSISSVYGVGVGVTGVGIA